MVEAAAMGEKAAVKHTVKNNVKIAVEKVVRISVENFVKIVVEKVVKIAVQLAFFIVEICFIAEMLVLAPSFIIPPKKSKKTQINPKYDSKNNQKIIQKIIQK